MLGRVGVLDGLKTASTAMLSLASTSKEPPAFLLLSLHDRSVIVHGELFKCAHCARENLSWMEDDHDDECEEHGCGVEGILVGFVVP